MNVLFLLVIIQLVFIVFSYQLKNFPVDSKADIFGLRGDVVDAIDLMDASTQLNVSILKDDHRWYLSNYFHLAANEFFVQRLLKTLLKPNQLKRIGQGSDLVDRFGLEEQSAKFLITLKHPKGSKKMVVGQSNENFYLRDLTDLIVYQLLAFEQFDNAFTPDWWLDKNLSISKSSLQKITLHDQGVALSYKGGRWQLNDTAAELDHEAFKVFLDHLSNRLIVSQALSTQSVALKKAVFHTTVEKQTGDVVDLAFYMLDDQYYLTHSDYQNIVFKIPLLTYERFVADRLSLLHLK